VPLARRWFAEGKDHSGVVLSIQLTRGKLLQQTEKLLRSTSVDDLWNAVRWLQEFK
jgi:hypothetical protein